MEFQPAEGGFVLEDLLLFFLLGEIQDVGAAEGGEVAVEGLGVVGEDEEEGAVVAGVSRRIRWRRGSCRRRPCRGW